MREILFASLMIICGVAGTARADGEVFGPPKPDPKLEELVVLPSVLTVAHTPEAVPAELSGPGGSRWTHSTTVSAAAGPVTILEFGYLVERDGHWVSAAQPGTPYTADDFAKWYDCPGAVLQPGRSYTDQWNQSMNESRGEQPVRWYFIGLDAAGRRIKGEADVTLLSDSSDGC